MQHRYTWIVLAAVVVGASCTRTSDSHVRPSPSVESTAPTFEVHYPHGQKNVHGLENNIEIAATAKSALIDISSESGIATGVIRLTAGSWPENVTVRLHLAGLEGLTISSGAVVFQKEDLTVKAFDRHGNLFHEKYLLDKKGYYEIELPSALFADQATEVTIHWVDFYR
ncbi:MAG: hypothetical protein RLZ44_1849 [Pseudomonadota bacterium]